MSTKCKPKFTYGKHKVTGGMLKDMQLQVSTLFMELCDSYGKSCKAVKILRKLEGNLLQLRSELDNQSYRDYPETKEEDRCMLYYGTKK